jgi:hypothetical protein
MHANTQIFWNDLTARRALLSCASRVDFDQSPTGPFCLVGQEIKEHRPCRIVDVSVEDSVVAVDHLFGLQVFDKNRTESIYYIPAELMQKVFALIADFGMKSGKILSGLAGALFGMFTLKIFELFFGLFQVLRVVYDIAVGHRGKDLDADINSYLIGAWWQGFWRDIIAGESGVEMPVLTLDCNGLDLAFQVPVQLDPDASDVLDIEFAVLQSDAVTVGRERDRIEAIPAFEPGESWRVSCFDTAKESLKRFVQAPQDILGSGIVKLGNALVKDSDFFKRIGLIVIVD